MLISRTHVFAAGLLVSALWPAVSEAVIVMNPTAGRNLGAPPGALATSGYQWQGEWNNSYLGTAIASQYFVTASHIGGNASQQFKYNFNSQLYTIDTTYGAGGFVDDPNSDLRIWKITGSFPTFAPLYVTNDEVGKSLVVYGRGTARGGEVRRPNTPPDPVNPLQGWFWGASDGQQSWGENAVSSIETAEVDPGDPPVGQLLRFTFDNGAGPNESHLSVGDSGGGVFIDDGSGWKLAGINYSVDGSYSLTGETGSGFNAAIFEQKDLWIGNDVDGWEKVETSQPGGSYSTRIWSNLDFIAANTTGAAVPEPGSAVLIFLASAALLRARRRR